MPESVIETISKAVDAPPIDIETIAEGFITASDTLAHSPGRELILLYLMTSVRSGIREHFKLKEGPDRIERMIVTIGTDQIGMGSHRCEAAAMLLGSIQMMPEI